MTDLVDEPPLPQSDGNPMLEVQRTLGRIEGLQKQLLDTFSDHAEADRKAFDKLKERLDDCEDAIERRLKDQDDKIAALKSDADRAKGAGAVIMILLGSAATFIGGALMAFLKGHIKFA